MNRHPKPGVGRRTGPVPGVFQRELWQTTKDKTPPEKLPRQIFGLCDSCKKAAICRVRSKMTCAECFFKLDEL